MTKYLLEKFKELVPYTPGEQPQGGFIKLNTNESPFPPSERARERMKAAFDKLNLYNDPENAELTKVIARCYGLDKENVLVTNGSDEALAFLYIAYAEKGKPFAAPEISYGFYPVFSRLVGAEVKTFPLKEDFSVDEEAFIACDDNVIFANPNAQTGTFMAVEHIERMLSKPRLVIVDEAYVDFGAQSVKPLVKSRDNLVVVGTLSKSRALAGGRIGFVIAAREIIDELKLIKYSFNPYNLGRAAEALAIGAFEDEKYFSECVSKVIEAREFTDKAVKELGMVTVKSQANFILMRAPGIDGGELKEKLMERGVLVRHFSTPGLSPFIRVTIGSMEQMKTFVKVLKNIISGA